MPCWRMDDLPCDQCEDHNNCQEAWREFLYVVKELENLTTNDIKEIWDQIEKGDADE